MHGLGKTYWCWHLCSYKHSDQVVSIKIDKDSDEFLCPWSNLLYYLTDTVLRADVTLFAISVTEFSDILSRCASQAGVKTRLTPHSFRWGGATWFSSNGITDAKLKAYGMLSSNAYLSYVKADWFVCLFYCHFDFGENLWSFLQDLDLWRYIFA